MVGVVGWYETGELSVHERLRLCIPLNLIHCELAIVHTLFNGTAAITSELSTAAPDRR